MLRLLSFIVVIFVLFILGVRINSVSLVLLPGRYYFNDSTVAYIKGVSGVQLIKSDSTASFTDYVDALDVKYDNSLYYIDVKERFRGSMKSLSIWGFDEVWIQSYSGPYLKTNTGELVRLNRLDYEAIDKSEYKQESMGKESMDTPKPSLPNDLTKPDVTKPDEP